MNENYLAIVLLKYWKKKYYRRFTWRKYKAPYKILIAELMLHRTKAEQVHPVYIDILSKYPNFTSLANAQEKDILLYINKLGLQWRAKHFIHAAQYVIKKTNKKIPQNRNELLKIPGIGDYIAGALLTVCFKKKTYVIDSNIARFLNRFYNFQLIGELRRKKKIKDEATKLFNFSDTRNLLFALLDFTALICKPINPNCHNCILNIECGYTLKKIMS